ncbi:MAG: CaiB/BaiF CoA transferase family protein, partial [Alphaproteobacteria bacterium]
MTGHGPCVGALDGLKVLDLSRVLAGPWCAMTLGDMGADVWKVEHPDHGDDTRAWGPPFFGTESAYYLFVNRHKRSIAIDLKHPEGRALVVEMALKADVLVENFRTGALAAYGLDWDTLRAKNPRLIYCSISGYGRTGPKANYPGYDYLAQAECGLMSITGEADGNPVKVGVAIVDLMCGMTATQGVLAALAARERTGRGQLVDCALHDVGVAALANVAASTLITGARPKRYGNAHATVVPYEAFNAADGDFVDTVGNDRQFDTLCPKVIDR